MKVFSGSITTLARSGYCTLQVPDMAIGSPFPPEDEIPASWVHYLRNDIPVVGKQAGFLFLTRVGYEANKEALRVAFEESIADPQTNRGHSWADFQVKAERHFFDVKRASQRRLTKLRADVEELQGKADAL